MLGKKKYKVIRIVSLSICYILILFLLIGFHKNIFALAALLLLFWTPYRYAVCNIDKLIRSLVVNAVNYFRYKEYNYPGEIGTITGYVAHTNKVFGCCKTLSAVYHVYKLYHKYNNASTYDYRSSAPSWVTWRVRVISNVDIQGIPVIPFKNLNQLVALADGSNDNIYTIVLIDEGNAVFNSRSFKTNFQNEEQLKALVTCRHNNMQLIVVGQRYKYLDALLRNIMDSVYECVHIPVLNTVIHYVYSAYDLETIDNPAFIKKICWKFTYLEQWVYKLYDTKALVDLIAKTPALSSAEVLERRQRDGSVLDARNLSRKGKKIIKNKG